MIGRNGAGKSTLLKNLGGMIRPHAGQRVSKAHKATLLARGAGSEVVLNGRDNIVLSAMLPGSGRTEIAAQMDEIIDCAEVGWRIDQPLSAYSLGMGARPGFAVSSRLEPHILILLIDEALGLGDAALQAKSTKLIEDRLASHRTVVLLSQDPQAVRRPCNLMISTALGGVVDAVLHERTGLLVDHGAPEQIAAAVLRLPREVDLARRLSAEASALVRREFSRETGARAFSELFLELLGGFPNAGDGA